MRQWGFRPSLNRGHSGCKAILLRFPHQGRVASFKHCLVLMTTNVGASLVHSNFGKFGFFPEEEQSPTDEYTQTQEAVKEALGDRFVPELMNRLDEVVVFRPLEEEHVR